MVDFNDLEVKLKKKGWSLDYIYVDSRRNRYSVETKTVS